MYDTIIIGGGIAGETAAIYAARERMKYLLIAKELGGQFMESGEVLNYPGIVETTGAGFASTMKKQLDFNGVKPNEGETVTNIENSGEGFKVTTDKASYDTKTVIIATGSKPRMLGVPGEKEYARKGVTYCAICDGPIFAGKDVAIVGAGDSALEAVSIMSKIAKKIYLLNIGKEFTAHKYLVERLKDYKNLEILNESTTKEVLGEVMVNGLKYEKNGEEHKIDVQGIIVEIGRVPSTDFLKGAVDLNSRGYIQTDGHTKTSVEGIFAAGDCVADFEYQYVIAAGQGSSALIKVSKYLAGGH